LNGSTRIHSLFYASSSDSVSCASSFSRHLADRVVIPAAAGVIQVAAAGVIQVAAAGVIQVVAAVPSQTRTLILAADQANAANPEKNQAAEAVAVGQTTNVLIATAPEVSAVIPATVFAPPVMVAANDYRPA
jgi:hypothetical protein